MKLLPEHVQGARGLLKMSRADLAEAASVSEVTIWHFETEKKIPRDETLLRIVAALEWMGIEFLNSGSPGVRYHPERDRRRQSRPSEQGDSRD